MLPIDPPAEVEVDSSRRYMAVNDAACELLGYSREELLRLTIDQVSYPSGAHVSPMFTRFLQDGSMSGGRTSQGNLTGTGDQLGWRCLNSSRCQCRSQSRG